MLKVFEVPVPSKSHKNIRTEKQQDCFHKKWSTRNIGEGLKLPKLSEIDDFDHD